MATQDPLWQEWNDSTARNFHAKEITVFTAVPHKGVNTTYRNDYPEPPLHWVQPPPPDHSQRPTPEFGHTTSHRYAFKEWPLMDAPRRGQRAEQKHNPKLSAMTTSRNDYKCPLIPAPVVRTPHQPFRPRDATMGTTTMRADFLPWEMPSHPGRPQPPGSKPTKFQGNTTTRNDYNWPKELPPPPPPKVNPAHVVTPFEGSTTYRDSYEIVPLPPGMSADIGLQVATRPYKAGGIGGQFELMIKQGTPAPAAASKTFTTVVDGQNTAAIVVVAKRAEHPDGVILGYFNMAGIKAAPTGIPKVDVTLKLADEKTLHASAVYRQGNKAKTLTFAAKKGPPLRTVAQLSDVPRAF